MAAQTAPPSVPDLFTPKLVTVFREGYRLAGLRADALAGLTVAIVALPLSMAIAIASGVSPDRGLTTSIVGGFLVSLLGGSRFQIGGPAGAFIVLVAAAVEQHGIDGLLLATMLSGVIMLAIGLLRLGTYIKYIPFPVVVGFTAGIAAIIFASQLSELLGLTLQGKEPGPLLPKLLALGHALPTLNPAAALVSAVTIGVIVAVRRVRPHWPAMLIAVAFAALASAWLGLPVATIGTRFGGIPHTLALPQWPALSLQKIGAVLPTAASFALLGSIESLLSAVVADSMTGRRHRSNGELAAQGVANIASALFGGICVTGAIARTATNVRSGARSPVAGMLHAAFLLAFMLVAAPLASYIPLATLAAVLAVVAWNMAERHAFATLLRSSRGDAVVLLATFVLVVFRDLTEGIVVGFAIASLLFLHRMAQTLEVENGSPAVGEDLADRAGGPADRPYASALVTDPDVVIYRISGAFFFGAAASVAAALDAIGEHPKAYVIDCSAIPFLDSTAAATLEGFVRKAHGNGAAVYVACARRPIRRLLLVHGLRPPRVRYLSRLDAAIEAAEAHAARLRRSAAPGLERDAVAARSAGP